ncbi:transposase [Streptomyces sp900116325]|uniref:transposase n=1 Tax=Streptomyces sp. 900116325 TaxID=3154295 RepID=UPI0033A593E2
MGRNVLIYCGIDWAERTHDVALVDDSGQLLAKRHITDDAAGYTILLDLLVEYGDSEENPIPVAIETSRFTEARGLKAYAGASPVTRASGKKSSITRRWVKNDRLNAAGYLWAFASITASPGAKAHYRRRRDERGDWHAAAQRNLFNPVLGQLYYCLKNHTLFDETTAFPTALAAAA